MRARSWRRVVTNCSVITFMACSAGITGRGAAQVSHQFGGVLRPQ